MSHYTKPATLGVSLIGATVLLLGAMGVAYTLFVELLTSDGASPANMERWTSSILYLVAGTLIYALSGVIGRGLCA